jgi:hypothetical protein
MSNTKTVYIVEFKEWHEKGCYIRNKNAYSELMQATEAGHAWANQDKNTNDFDIDIVEYA